MQPRNWAGILPRFVKDEHDNHYAASVLVYVLLFVVCFGSYQILFLFPLLAGLDHVKSAPWLSLCEPPLECCCNSVFISRRPALTRAETKRVAWLYKPDALPWLVHRLHLYSGLLSGDLRCDFYAFDGTTFFSLQAFLWDADSATRYISVRNSSSLCFAFFRVVSRQQKLGCICNAI